MVRSVIQPTSEWNTPFDSPASCCHGEPLRPGALLPCSTTLQSSVDQGMTFPM